MAAIRVRSPQSSEMQDTVDGHLKVVDCHTHPSTLLIGRYCPLCLRYSAKICQIYFNRKFS